MTEILPLFLSVAVLWFAAVAAPGPNLFVVMHTCLTNGRPVAMTVALGMSLGAGIWGLAGFFSIHGLFTAAPWLYLTLKLVGAAYLMWLGAALLLRSFRPAYLPHAFRNEIQSLIPTHAPPIIRAAIITNLGV